MGVMTRRTPESRRRLAKWAAAATVGLFLWSFIAAPSAQTADEDIAEPLSAYHVLADAAPVRGLIAHKAYLVEVEPAVARSTSEVALPSTATSTSWLADFGLANGLHGTTTGNKVPTEATATMPGGPDSEEFSLTSPTVGSGALMRFGAAVNRASARTGEAPRGFGHAYLANLLLLPAPGSPEAPPGTYDPEADEEKERERATPSPGATATPDDPQAFTPNPRGQMAILSIGSVASTADTFREDDKVVSIAVAELNGINIGNRTADGRCTNCITIDSMRIEARAESNGTPEGARSAWRVLLHRACRVAITNDPATGAAIEGVQCLDPNPDMLIEAFEERSSDKGRVALTDPNARGVRSVSTAQLDAMFAELAEGLGIEDIGLTLRIGTDEGNVASVETGGEQAAAAARGLVLELRTSGAGELILERIAGNDSFKAMIDAADAQCGTVANLPKPGPLASPPSQLAGVGLPPACGTAAVDTTTTSRTLSLALGHVRAVAKASPLIGGGGSDAGGDPGPQFPTITIPEIQIPTFNIPPQTGGNTTIVGGGGLQPGKFKVKVDWSSIRIRPWKAKDLAKGMFTGGIAFGIVSLMRRRFVGL